MLLFGLVIFAVLYGLMETGVIGSFWKLNILIIGVNIIMAASLNLINGYTGQFSLGHAGFMAVGAYVSVVLTANFHLPFLAALLAGGTRYDEGHVYNSAALYARPTSPISIR